MYYFTAACPLDKMLCYSGTAFRDRGAEGTFLMDVLKLKTKSICLTLDTRESYLDNFSDTKLNVLHIKGHMPLAIALCLTKAPLQMQPITCKVDSTPVPLHTHTNPRSWGASTLYSVGLSLRYGIQDPSWEQAYQSNFADFERRKKGQSQHERLERKSWLKPHVCDFDIQAADKQLDAL